MGSSSSPPAHPESHSVSERNYPVPALLECFLGVSNQPDWGHEQQDQQGNKSSQKNPACSVFCHDSTSFFLMCSEEMRSIAPGLKKEPKREREVAHKPCEPGKKTKAEINKQGKKIKTTLKMLFCFSCFAAEEFEVLHFLGVLEEQQS